MDRVTPILTTQPTRPKDIHLENLAIGQLFRFFFFLMAAAMPSRQSSLSTGDLQLLAAAEAVAEAAAEAVPPSQSASVALSADLEERTRVAKARADAEVQLLLAHPLLALPPIDGRAAGLAPPALARSCTTDSGSPAPQRREGEGGRVGSPRGGGWEAEDVPSLKPLQLAALHELVR